MSCGSCVTLRFTGRTLNRDADDEFEGISRSCHVLRIHSFETSVQLERVQGDEENLLEILPRNSHEAIVSCLSLHWVNDLPGVSLGLCIQPLSDAPFIFFCF